MRLGLAGVTGCDRMHSIEKLCPDFQGTISFEEFEVGKFCSMECL